LDSRGDRSYQVGPRHHGIHIFMSGNGNCYDNAMGETFFKTLKSEMVWRMVFLTRSEAGTGIGHYVDTLYTRVRRHSALDFVSPARFERRAA
jgi:putative transposase